MSHALKYQVFISSTYTDLRDQRDQVVKAVLEMGHIPVGMEMFSAADEEQWNIIKRNIEASDYYVVIVAHRYGSVVEGTSFTEKEYDYAVQLKLPVLGFVIDDSAGWPEEHRDKGVNSEELAGKLKQFKEKVRRKPVGFWKTADDLHGKVAIALMKTMTAQPRTGWIPASQAASAESATELARLSKENSQLRIALEAARKSGETARRFTEIEESLKGYTLTIRIRFLGTVEKHPTNLLFVFDAIGKTLASGAFKGGLLRALEEVLAKESPHYLDPRCADEIGEWLDELILQDLVTYSRNDIPGQPFNETIELWTLTDIGRAFLRHRRQMKVSEPIPGSNSRGGGGKAP